MRTWDGIPLKDIHHFTDLGRGDDAVGNPRRAQIYQFELFELILLLKLGKQFLVERFEATASQSAVPSPPSQDRFETYAMQRALGEQLMAAPTPPYEGIFLSGFLSIRDLRPERGWGYQ